MLTKMVNKDGNLNNHAAAIIMRNVHGWDQKQTVEHTGKDGEALTFNFNLAPPEPIQIKDEHIIDDDEENNNG